MSAYLCGDETFSILGQFVRTVMRDQRTPRGLYVYDKATELSNHYLTPEQIVVILHAENVRSVNVRYNETSIETINPNKLNTLSFQSPKSVYLTLVARTIKCLEYQSCEAADYYDTLGYKVLTAIKNALITCVAEGL